MQHKGVTSISSQSYSGGGGSSGSPSSPSSYASSSYFSDFKKGEVNELLSLLRNSSTPSERAAGKQRDVVKKVIAYMTLGVDVSRLFSEMIMATNTTDLVQKKLVYLYLCNYAEEHADLSILAINTLLKDCHDDNPMVRGLALRSLSSLRLPSLREYLVPPVKAGLRDLAPYVRKTAVLGCAKLYRVAKAEMSDPLLINILYEMLRDRDPQVIANVIFALNEILSSEGGIAINRNIVVHLLNRLKDFNEWGQALVLETIAKYEPNPEEVLDMMNILEERLQHTNSSVVFAATRIFLKITMDQPQLHNQVLLRLKAPLLTITASGAPEVSFAALHHIHLLAYRSPGLFSGDYKVHVLTEIVSERNMHEVVTELAEYVRDVDVELGRLSLRAIGTVAAKLPAVARPALDTLLSFIDGAISYIGPITIIVMKDILRRYPEHVVDVIPVIKRCLKAVDEPEAKAAMIWILGEYGEMIDDAPYILEDIIEHYSEEPAQVKMQLLTATTKLFFKRPAECQPGLGVLLKNAVSDTSNIDVHDRALFYYRLISTNVNEAERVIAVTKNPISNFPEEDVYELKDRLFEEFNTLSVIYGQPADVFQKKFEPPNLCEVTYDGAEEEEEEEEGGDEEEEEEGDDEEEELQLNPTPKLDSQTFRQKWATLPPGGTFEATFPRVPGSVAELESRLVPRGILSAAAGLVGSQIKAYLFAQAADDGTFFFLELVVELTSKSLRVQLKTENTPRTNAFVTLFQQILSDSFSK